MTMSEPLELIAPGEILLEEFMRPRAVSQNRLARDIDVPVARINEIIKSKRAITADTALRLGKYSGTSAELWLGLQMEYDIRRARRDVWPAIEPQIRPLTAA
jgi:antitoxin HigA-1